MENKEINSKIVIKLLILEIFPSLQELSNNNSEIITISFQDKETDNDILFNLTDLLLQKKELDLSFSSNTSNIKLILNKNDILYASGLLPIKTCEQWVTLTYENKKCQGYSNLSLSLMDCIKLKIQCKIISGFESKNTLENKITNNKKKGKQILNQKKKTSQKKLNLNSIIQDSFNIDENKKSNKYLETNIKTQNTNPYTTINKNNIKKIELSGIKSNKISNKVNSKINFTSLRNENYKNISLGNQSKSKKIEDEIKPGLNTDIKQNNNNRGIKKDIEGIHLNLHSKNKNNSCPGIKKENNKYNLNKIMKKRKSDGIKQVNIIGHLYDINSSNINTKIINNLQKENHNKKKKSSDNIQSLKNLTETDFFQKSSRTNSIEKNNNKYNEKQINNKLFKIINEMKVKNIDNDEIIINHDVEKIQDDNIIIQNGININKNKKKENYNDIIGLDDEDIESDIFSKQLEDFKLLYSDEYLKSINNEYIKLEIELFIEKVLELNSLYIKQIEEKIMEYQIEKNNYYNNINQFFEINKLLNKLKYIEAQYQLKKYNVKEIKKYYFNNSINNLNTNKKQINIFKTNFFSDIEKKKNHQKEMLKIIIKKLIEKEKNMNIIDKNEKVKNWIKNNYLKKENKKVKENKVKNQKYSSKKVLVTESNNAMKSINNNNKFNITQTKSWKKKFIKTSNEDKGKNKNKK